MGVSEGLSRELIEEGRPRRSIIGWTPRMNKKENRKHLKSIEIHLSLLPDGGHNVTTRVPTTPCLPLNTGQDPLKL